MIRFSLKQNTAGCTFTVVKQLGNNGNPDHDCVLVNGHCPEGKSLDSK